MSVIVSPHGHRPASPASLWRKLLRSGPAMLGLGIMLLVTLIALFADVIAPGDPLEIVGRPFLWPGEMPGSWFGTDALGRDLLSGVIHGSRVSLIVGFTATIVGLLIGVLVGAFSGFFGGWVDRLLIRVIELFQTTPSFILVVVMLAIVQPSITTISLTIGLVSWPPIARLTRAEFRTLRQRDFISSARTVGYGNLRIMFSEILPNALSPVIVTSSVMVASAILMESALSFLGMGDPNLVSWGGMIGAGRESLRSAWYISAIPGAAIVLVVLALNFIGEGVNDALNPYFSDKKS